jgi:hypothetical protein
MLLSKLELQQFFQQLFQVQQEFKLFTFMISSHQEESFKALRYFYLH